MSELKVQVNSTNQQGEDSQNIQTQPIDKKITQQQHQQQQQDEPDYKMDNLLPKQNQKQKLIQQNIKLKTQIYQLALQLDEILQKDKLKKKKYGLSVEDEDQAIKAKKLQLKKQELQVVEVKNRIFQLKRQLDSVFNNQIVQDREDILKQVRKRLEELENQKDGLVKIKKIQAKAIKTVKNQMEFKEKIDKVHREVIRVKQQTQKLVQLYLQARKEEVNSHQRYVIKSQKIRQLESKLAQTQKSMKQKQKTKNPNPYQVINTSQSNNNKDTISNQLINDLHQQIRKLEIQKKQGQKVWQDKIRAIQNQLQFKRAEQQRKILIIRQKQKELKLNQIRIRQLRKLVKQNIIEQNTKKTQDLDMTQFRHKRNIRYIDK